MRWLFVILTLPFFFVLSCRSFNQAKLTKHDKQLSLQHGGLKRKFILHTPPHPNPQAALVINLHGGGGKIDSQIRIDFGRFNQLADQRGFYVVYPEGYEKAWNDKRDHAPSEAHKKNIDDVGFISALIDDLTSKYSIDKKKVFSTGISNGGIMSLRLACDLSFKIRAVAAVTAQMSENMYKECKPSGKPGVLLMNGTEDTLVPYNGGAIKIFRKVRGQLISTEKTLKFFQKHNGCGNQSETALPDRANDGTRVFKRIYTGCQLRLYRVEGGGHTWPGGWQYLGKFIIGRTSKDINASDEIWAFFSGFSN